MNDFPSFDLTGQVALGLRDINTGDELVRDIEALARAGAASANGHHPA